MIGKSRTATDCAAVRVGRKTSNLGPAGGRKFASILIALTAAAILLVAVVKLRTGAGGAPKVVIGTKDIVSYAPPETKEHAIALGRFFQSIGVFLDGGTNVLLARGAQGPILTFLVAEGSWDDAEVDASFEEIGRRAANVVGGFPVKIRLANAQKAVKKELVVGRLLRGGRDEVYYCGSATSSDSTALASALEREGYLRKNGDSVVLKKGITTTLSFTVRPAAYEGSNTVPTFERLTRLIASSVGGLPVKLRLVRLDGAVFYESMIQ